MEAEARGPHFSGASGSNNDGTKPGEECKAALFQALYEWFKETPFTNLNRNYLALGANVGKEAFMGRVRRLFEDAISGEEWDEDKRKANYSTWMEEKLVDALYNLPPIRVVLSDMLGGKDVVEGRDGRTDGRFCLLGIGRNGQIL
jgi:hypothetical protein